MAQDRLKERLTGAIALLVLGVIAWFWLLSAEDPAAPIAEETAIPPVPVIEPFPVPQPELPKELASVAPPDISAVEPEVAQSVEAETPTRRDAETPMSPEQSSAQPSPSPTQPRRGADAAPVQPPAAKQTYETDDDGLPRGWAVQVASLSTQASADKLVADLQAAGFKAYSRAVRSGDRTVHRVFTGPKLSREAAEADRQRIATAFKVQPMVVRFTPE